MLTKAIVDVVNERCRQVLQLGLDYEHDDEEHDAGELSSAGASYALNAASAIHPQCQQPFDEVPQSWPWRKTEWNPKDPRTDLVRAAALIIAEIERIDRAAASKGAPDEL